jgi:hypothetical protein
MKRFLRLSNMRRVPAPPPDAPFHDDEMARDVAALLGEPAFSVHVTHRHNGVPMVPPSAFQAVDFWESCHGDNVPILTAKEIEHIRKLPV